MTNACKPVLAAALLACLLGAAPIVARAQTETTGPGPALLTGTLAKVRESGTVRIGYRESSVPFSYLSARNEPIGYSIELCKALVMAIAEAVNREELAIRWVAVTSESRIDAVVGGQVDLECGSTTINVERQQRVSFSPTIFVAGTRLLVRQGSRVSSLRDLAGRKVAVTGGTTNEKTLRELSGKFKLGLDLVVSRDHAESFARVESGEAEAFATDDVLLYGLIAQKGAKARYKVVGDFLSYDPYGVMFRKGDAQLAKVVGDAFRALAADGEIERQYKRWFLSRLPSGGTSIDLPMSAQLETIIQAMAMKPE
jgi:ABC-type amino acid transport substrate-binding protein